MPPRNAPSQRPRDVIQRSKRESIPSVLQFPKDLGAHSVLMIFNDYSYQKPGERELNKIGSSTYSATNLKNKTAILLPLPSNIEDTYSVRVQGFEQGLAGAEISAAASQFAGAGDITLTNLKNTLAASLPSVDWNSVFSADLGQISRNIAFLGRRTIDKALPGTSRNIDVGLGNTINPKASLYFEGVNLKQFNFNWTLAPTEESESDTIKDITNAIKRKSLPSYGNAVGLSKALLNYPSLVDIFFLGIQQDYFVYYKTCMIQQFSTNFTPNGLAFVKGGKPAIVSMSMGLIETDIHTSEDYDGESTFNFSVSEPSPF